MNKKATQSLEIPLPKARSIFAELPERMKLYNIEEIAQAKTLDGVKAAMQKGVASFVQFDELQLLQQLQETAQKLQKDPENTHLQESLHATFVRVQKNTSVQNGQYAWGQVHYLDVEYFYSVRQDLINEYRATTPSELLVIDTILVAYFRYMRVTSAFNSFVEDNNGNQEYSSQTWINMMKELNKAIASASQQFMTALTFLKELKRQPVQVKVHTKKAYFATNQQINEDHP